MKKNLKFALVIGVLLISLTCLFNLNYLNPHSSISNFFTNTVFAQQRLPVTVLEQPDSPLKISEANSNVVSPKDNEIETVFTLTNLAGVPINAYAIRYDITCDNKNSAGVSINNIISSDKVLQAGKIIRDQIANIGCSIPVTDIKLSVDYVEFIDGGTWGNDSFRTKDNLTGLRDGAQAESDELRTIAQTQGLNAVVNEIQKVNSSQVIPQGRSQQYVDGYLNGRRFRRSQIQHIVPEGDLNKIDNILKQPFDASKRRQ